MNILSDHAGLYDLIFQSSWWESEISLYSELAVDRGGRVLDLCCATGRIAIPLAQRGFEVTGVDFSPEMLNRAKRKGKANVKWELSDARCFSLNRKFGLTLLAFNSLQSFRSTKDCIRLFGRIGKHMSECGLLVGTVSNPVKDRTQTDKVSFRRLKDIVVPSTKQTISVDQRCLYDKKSRMKRTQEVLWLNTENQIQSVRVSEYEGRIYSPSEIRNLLKSSGLELVAEWGTFNRAPYLPKTSDKYIFCAQRTDVRNVGFRPLSNR